MQTKNIPENVPDQLRNPSSLSKRIANLVERVDHDRARLLAHYWPGEVNGLPSAATAVSNLLALQAKVRTSTNLFEPDKLQRLVDNTEAVLRDLHLIHNENSSNFPPNDPLELDAMYRNTLKADREISPAQNMPLMYYFTDLDDDELSEVVNNLRSNTTLPEQYMLKIDAPIEQYLNTTVLSEFIQNQLPLLGIVVDIFIVGKPEERENPRELAYFDGKSIFLWADGIEKAYHRDISSTPDVHSVRNTLTEKVVGIIAHEAGHALLTYAPAFILNEWENVRATQPLPGLTDYSEYKYKTSPTRGPCEEFCEALRLYLTNPSALKNLSPKRYEVLSWIMYLYTNASEIQSDSAAA